MLDYFDSPRRKLKRAKKYIANLERERDVFINEQPWSSAVEINLDTGLKEFKVRFNGDISDSFGDIASNVLQNLRAALDQSVNSAARASGKSDPRKARFPFGDTPEGLEHGIKGWCKDVPPDIVALVRTFKPYRTGNQNPILWALNNTANVDKHSMVCPCEGTLNHVVRGGPAGAIRPLFVHPPRFDRGKNEIVYAVCPPEVSPGCHFHLSFDIAFGEIAAVGGEPVLGVLKAMAGVVESVLVAIEALTRRLFPAAFC